MEDGNSRLRQAQEEVEEVKDIMLDNLNKAEERTGKLGDLENRADRLLEKSKAFEKTAVKLKKQKRWENTKMKIVAGGILAAVVLVVIIVLAATLSTGYSSHADERSAPDATTAANST
ncbi:hypothetical protein GJAV_G00034840 [Gymnothorax javanicus]|nr:hypothetical protein GJAV_G00034840 [Gymnothorax javanicus]